VKSEIEGSELFVNSFVQDPVQVETDEFVSIGVGNGNLMTPFHQVDNADFIVFAQRDLHSQMERSYDTPKPLFTLVSH
jgi:hypothetical protein